MTSVRYVPAISTDAGAIPVGTEVATHPRSGDGYKVQDVYIDPVNTVTTTRADDFYNDAFQRLRVSDTDQRFDGDFTYDLSPLLFDRIGSGGTVTHDANSRDVVIALAAATTGNGFQIDVSAAVTTVWHEHFHQLASTGTLSGGNSVADDASAGVSSGIPATGIYPVTGFGVLITGANTGTAQLRFRSETTAVATCKAGTTWIVTKVA